MVIFSCLGRIRSVLVGFSRFCSDLVTFIVLGCLSIFGSVDGYFCLGFFSVLDNVDL